MVIGLATLTLHLPEAGSLKDKRRVLRSVTARMRQRFNIAIAEVDTQDEWRVLTLGIACISNDARHAHAMLEKVAHAIQDLRLDAELAGYTVEVL